MAKVIFRNSNLELLRIVSMIMIVGLHYFNGIMGGGALAHLTTADYNYYITYFFESMFVVSVGCYVLITGYFQIEKKFITFSKVLEIFIQVMFYSLVCFLIAVQLGEVSFTVKRLAGIVLLSSVKNWFVQTYIILYALSPFLNICLNNLDKKAYEKFLLMMISIFSVWPSFFPYPPVTDNGYGIITFILLYSLGGYLKKHYVSSHTKKYYFTAYILCAVTTFVLQLTNLFTNTIWGYNFFFNVFGAIFLFLFFTKLNIESKKINYIASFAFGVFLIHTNWDIRTLIYEKILHCSLFWFSPLFILHAIGSVLLVYSTATLIDMCRKWIFIKITERTNHLPKKHLPILWKQIP
jgi:surface polysaccharide O-acyltransferase-like enzyme